MKSVDPQLIVLGATVAVLIAKGVLIRTGVWTASQWAHFITETVICTGFVYGGFSMLSHLDRNWSSDVRLVYLLAAMVSIFYCGFLGLQLIMAFAGDGVLPRLYDGLPLAFVSLILAFGAAAWMQMKTGIPYQQSGAVVLGSFAIWLGAWRPAWLDRALMYRTVVALIGEKTMRASYIAVGVVLVGFGIAGQAHIFR